MVDVSLYVYGKSCVIEAIQFVSFSFSLCMSVCLSIMASGSPLVNGDVSCTSGQSGTLEETLEQMNILIQENRDLKGEARSLDCQRSFRTFHLLLLRYSTVHMLVSALLKTPYQD